MATITVNKLATSNTKPTITGTVDFERFDKQGNAKETIQVVVNYTTYKLFDGNLGLDETKKPNIWKLHFDTPLYRGTTYNIDAQVIDVATNRIIAQDATNGELVITQLTQKQTQQQDMNILQKMALIGGLMGALDNLFGGQSGMGQSSSIHPVKDDDASTSLAGRADEERKEDPAVKDLKRRQAADKIPLPPKRPPMLATSGDGGEPGFSGASGDILTDALKGNVSDEEDARRMLSEAQAKQDAETRFAVDEQYAANAAEEQAKLEQDYNMKDAAAAGQATSVVEYNQQQEAAGRPRAAGTLRNAGIFNNYGRTN
jgi:hypothetical protein